MNFQNVHYRCQLLTIFSLLAVVSCTKQPDPKTLSLTDYQFSSSSNDFSRNCPRFINDQEYGSVMFRFPNGLTEKLDTRLALRNIKCEIYNQTYQVSFDVMIASKKSNSAFKLNTLNIPVNYKISLEMIPNSYEILPKNTIAHYKLTLKNTSRAFLSATDKQTFNFPIDAYDVTQSIFTIGLTQ